MKLEQNPKQQQTLAQTLIQCFALVTGLTIVAVVAVVIFLEANKVIAADRPIPTSLIYHGKTTN